MTLAQKLERAGFKVEHFDCFHKRIDGLLDIWGNSHGRPLKWHDLYSQERGKVRESEAFSFVKNRLAAPRTEASRESFLHTLCVACGWPHEEAEKAWDERQKEKKCQTQSK